MELLFERSTFSIRKHAYPTEEEKVLTRGVEKALTEAGDVEKARNVTEIEDNAHR